MMGIRELPVTDVTAEALLQFNRPEGRPPSACRAVAAYSTRPTSRASTKRYSRARRRCSRPTRLSSRCTSAISRGLPGHTGKPHARTRGCRRRRPIADARDGPHRVARQARRAQRRRRSNRLRRPRHGRPGSCSSPTVSSRTCSPRAAAPPPSRSARPCARPPNVRWRTSRIRGAGEAEYEGSVDRQRLHGARRARVRRAGRHHRRARSAGRVVGRGHVA